MRKTKREEFLKLQKSRKKIEVIILLKFTYEEVSSNSKPNLEIEDFLKSILNSEVNLEMDMETIFEL